MKISKAYLEISNAWKIELFPKIINYINPLSIFAKGSILDVCQYSRYTSDIFKKAVTDKLQ